MTGSAVIGAVGLSKDRLIRQSVLLLLCVALALGSGLARAQSNAQAGGSTQSQTSVSAGQSGASATGSGAAAADAQGHGVQAASSGGGELNATLSKPVDAGRNKPGDEVTAVAAEDLKSNGDVVIPEGSRLIGHVTSARPKGTPKASGADGASASNSGAASAAGSAAAGAGSELGVVFDKAVLRNGREVPLRADIQAIAAAASAADLQSPNMAMSGGGGAFAGGRAGGGPGGGALGGVGGTVRGATGATSGLAGGLNGTVGTTAGVVGHSVGAVGGLNSAGQLAAGSRGAFGMKGLDVTSGAAASGQGSLVTSSTRNVRLESGTRMLLVTSAGGAATQGGSRASPDRPRQAPDKR
jgi:hypothetical protein